MKKLSELTNDEKSLLLFFECAYVDYGGKLNTAHINNDDRKIIQKWKQENFITFDRLYSKSIGTDGKTHAVSLSENAFNLAHEERKARAKRVFEKRTWLTVNDRQPDDLFT